MRKITFPHMGELYLPLKTLIEELGQEVVIPPKISKKTLDLGVKYAPEFACLPLKVNLGNFIESLEKGADTIIMGGGCGPCRFGFYGEVQREILKELGYQFDMLVLEPELLKDYYNFKRVFEDPSLYRILRAFYLAIQKVSTLDAVYQQVLKSKAKERKAGLVDRYYQDFLRELDQTNNLKGIKNLKNEFVNKIVSCESEYKMGFPVNIGIVGEIYLVIEPFVNLNIEKKLGDLGVTVHKEINMSNWLKHFLHLSKDMKLIEQAADSYLRSFVGGHGLDSVGNAVRYAKLDYDGVIQVAPFTCMPEIIAETILPAVSKEQGIPVMTLVFDEHSADAGLITRLEAFVDLIARNKMKGNEFRYG